MLTEGLKPGEYREYARGRLEEALFVLDSGSDIEILAAVELALMALHRECGSAGTITLNPADVDEIISEPEPACSCPPDLMERGGFRSGCPVHGSPATGASRTSPGPAGSLPAPHPGGS